MRVKKERNLLKSLHILGKSSTFAHTFVCKEEMTDKEYIVAFAANDQNAFAKFYNENRLRFMTAIGNKFAITDEYALASILTDACMRLWLNIRNEKLTVESLHTTLSGYLYGIGERVALEYLHENSNQVSFEAIESVFADEPINRADETTLLWKAARRALAKLKDSCVKLLQKFYFEKMNWEAISQQLGYSSADSAKTQKNKCMAKLKEEAQIQLRNLE